MNLTTIPTRQLTHIQEVTLKVVMHHFRTGNRAAELRNQELLAMVNAELAQR